MLHSRPEESWSAIALVACLLTAFPIAGQMTFGTITGTVTDSTGAVMPNVAVTVTNEGTGVQRAASTTATGVYVVPNLNAGTYRVRIEKSGFASFTRVWSELIANSAKRPRKTRS